MLAIKIYWDHDGLPYNGNDYGNNLPIGETSQMTAYFTDLEPGTEVRFEQCSGVQQTTSSTKVEVCESTGAASYTADSMGVLTATVPVSFDFATSTDPAWDFCNATVDGSFPEYTCDLYAIEVGNLDPSLVSTSIGLYFVNPDGGDGGSGGGDGGGTGSTGPLTKEECMKDGWTSFTNPEFKNQGACISYVVSNKH